MADDIEEYWEGIRPPRPAEPEPSSADQDGMRKVVVEEYQEPLSFNRENLNSGLRAISRYRTQLARGDQLGTTPEELDYLERTLRHGLGIPDSVPSMSQIEALQSWMATPAAQVAFISPSDSQQRHPALLNLERAFEALGLRCEVWVEDDDRLHVALTDLSGDNWASQQLTMGGMQLVIDLHR